jgi:hypothetical protein
MIRNPKTCFFVFMSFVFIFMDITVSGENNIEQQKNTANKLTFEKRQKNKCLPWVDERYYMMIIGRNCHSDLIDPGIIAKNAYDPSIQHELRVIDPYTKKEITWDKMPCFGFNMPETKLKDKDYKIPITVPSE